MANLKRKYDQATTNYPTIYDKTTALRYMYLNIENPLEYRISIRSKSSLRKFYGRNSELVNRYGISASQMTTDMFRWRYHNSVLSSFMAGFGTKVTHEGCI